MLLGLKGQGAVVYGGARGIGHAIARELAGQNVRVVTRRLFARHGRERPSAGEHDGRFC